MSRHSFIRDDLMAVAYIIVGGLMTVAMVLGFGIYQASALDADYTSSQPCLRTIVVVRHNRPVRCDLSGSNILIEMGTSRSECNDQGGRFMVVNDRRLCVGEDF
jgi:hypothetical protein